MSESALVEVVKRILAGGYDPVAAIVEDETDRGFKVVRPGDAPWFPVADWRPASVASIDRDTVRLVLIHSHESGKGAMTRMLAAINAAGLAPTVLEPTPQLADALRRRGWRSRDVRLPLDRETIWSPPASDVGGVAK
jgi:hypothetical protein